MDVGEYGKGFLVAKDFTAGARFAANFIKEKHDKEIVLSPLNLYPINHPANAEEREEYYRRQTRQNLTQLISSYIELLVYKNHIEGSFNVVLIFMMKINLQGVFVIIRRLFDNIWYNSIKKLGVNYGNTS